MGQLHDFFLPLILAFSCLSGIGLSQNPQQPPQPISNGASSDLVNLKYHMGPVLAPPIHLYTIWYGNWDKAHQAIIRNFLMSLYPSKTPSPSVSVSVSDWWRTVQLYTDQTGANVTGDILLQGEHHDDYSHGKSLTRLTVQSVIKTAIEARPKPLPLDPHRGMYLLLTSGDVQVAEFCRAVCGFHSFTFPAVVGAVVPYAWVGYSGLKCPGMCGYPKEMQKYDYPSPTSSGDQGKDMGPPNGDVGADGMVSIIGHELAESATNPLDNAWYAGDEPTSPNEIADLCLGVYGPGAGGGYIGMVSKDSQGRGYNVNGVNGNKFLVQWIWDPVRKRCFGPNAQN